MTLVVLSTPFKFNYASWAIKKITHFDASHASIHFHGSGTFAGQPLVFEATSHGIGITHGCLWRRQSRVVHAFEVIVDPEIARKALGFMWEHLGEDYDYKGIGYFAWRLFLKRCFGLDVRAPETNKEMFCSELVSRWYLHLYDVLGREPPAVLPEETSPADLAALLERDDLFRRVP